jgi:hypothetical protein
VGTSSGTARFTSLRRIFGFGFLAVALGAIDGVLQFSALAGCGLLLNELTSDLLF